MMKAKTKPPEFRMTRKDRWQTVVKRRVIAAKLRAARKHGTTIHRIILMGCYAYEIGDITIYPIWS